ncbi:radical SAM protein [Halobacteriovorax marinus]|uniref:radical SAM protein n=1 Tax=Halobacteriovorax marinus TaxID=97084 RepID=UPI003A923063
MFNFKELRHIHIELTSKCNARCGNCPRNFYGGAKYEWLQENEYTIERFKNDFPPHVLKQINFLHFCGSYGDPAACNDLEEIIEYASSFEIDLQINTNISMRSKKSWKRISCLLKKGSRIVLSIDGLEDTNHLYRRGTNWKKIEENILALEGTRADIIWECLLFKHNVHQKELIIKQGKEWKVDEVVFKNPLGFEVDNRGVSYMPMVDKEGRVEYILYPHEQNVSSVYNAKLKLELNILKDKVKSDYQPKEYRQNKSDETSNISCRSLDNKEIYIDARGVVYPCCFFGALDNPLQMDTQLLDYLHFKDMDTYSLTNRSLEEIMNSNFYSEVQNSWTCKSYSEGRLAICDKYCSKKKGDFHKIYK